MAQWLLSFVCAAAVLRVGAAALGFDLASVLPAGLLRSHADQVDAVQRYIDTHNKAAVLQDPQFCNRTYAVAVYAAPLMMGNHMHEFLNSFALAYVTNRTVFHRFCDRKPCKLDNEDDFRQVFALHPWMLSQSEFQEKWSAECSGSPHPRLLITIHQRSQAEEVFACCGLDGLDATYPIIDFGTHEAHQSWGTAVAHSRLGPDAKRRAQLLFLRGEDLAFGLLFRSSVAVQRWIQEKNDILVAPHVSADTLLVAMHLRHAAIEDVTQKVDSAGMECLTSFLEEQLGGRKCALLLASDRQESFERWRAALAAAGAPPCTLVHTNHTANLAPRHRRRRLTNEHGPFTGVLSVLDLDLLSRSHLFVGSTYLVHPYRHLASTFSLLIAELIASNGHSLVEASPARYLPECRPTVGGKKEGKPVFTNTSYHCETPYLLYNIPAPQGCAPYPPPT